MSRRISIFPSDSADDDVDDDLFDDLRNDAFAGARQPQRRRSPRHDRARVALEGRSGRWTPDLETDVEPDSLATLSSYDVAAHGPEPAPSWLVTALAAVDTPLGLLKTGKEADVCLLDRSVPGGRGCLLAVKTYRDSQHRMFHRDAGYQEGRRIRRSRETRAMAGRTGFGRELLAGKWAAAEFTALSRLWTAGVRVPYPVQLLGTELMMEFVGEPDGTAAPRLAAWDATSADFAALWQDLAETLERLAEHGLTHGDLSPYNVLVHDGRSVLIDLPQVVDVIGNPQGRHYLQRDCRVIAEFFARRGVTAADGELLALHLADLAGLPPDLPPPDLLPASAAAGPESVDFDQFS